MTKATEKVIKKILLGAQVAALTITLAGLAGCKKAEEAETENSEGILENEGELEIQVPEGEETFGE